MSVTVHTQPLAYTPCYNPQIFTATSTNVNQANFVYTVVCTDEITSASTQYDTKRRLDNLIAFDGSNFSKNYVKHYIPKLQYGWQVCTDGLREITVNIGETYGTTPAYASGTDISYYVWNAALPYRDFPNYAVNDYLYSDGISYNPVELGLFNTAKTYQNRSLFAYFLCDNAPILGLQIDTFDANNNLLGTSTIANPYSGSPNYYERYVCIDIGYKGLDNIASGLVTGTYPILNDNVSYYTITDASLTAPQPETFKTITIESECYHEVYTLHYLTYTGKFETIHFSKVSETNVGSEKTYYRRNPYTMETNVWSYDIYERQQRVLTSTSQTRVKLNSDWMSYDECDKHRYLISSPAVYLDLGNDLIPVKVVTNNWLVNKKWNNKIYSVSVDIEFDNIDTWQNG